MGELKELPKKLVELNYSDPQIEVLETTADRVLFLSGVGGGKTRVLGVIAFDLAINNPEINGLIAANTYKQLSGATLNGVFTLWQETFGLKEGLDYVVDIQPPSHFKRIGPDKVAYKGTISFANGALIYTASLENYQALDGFEFGWACLDETKDTKEEAVKKVIIQRLRQKGLYINPLNGVISKTEKPNYKGYNPLFIFTSPAKTEWLSAWFKIPDFADKIQKVIFSSDNYFRMRNGRFFMVIASSWHNEKNLPPGTIQGWIDDLANDKQLIDMQIYASPFGKTGGEFITTWDRFKHIGKFEPWKDEAVHLSFDFNYVPYMTCTCWQMKFMDKLPKSGGQGYLVRCFDEFCLPNPNNNCEDICRKIIEKYSWLLKVGLFFYGDYSGKNSSPMVKEFKNYYKVIEKELKRFLNNFSDRVIVNQPLGQRRLFINKALRGDYPFEIEVHQQCVQLIADCEFCKEGPDGGKLKEIELVGEVRCQKRGHALDSKEYFLTSAFNNLFMG